MKILRILVTSAIVALCAIGFSACGSSSNSSPPVTNYSLRFEVVTTGFISIDEISFSGLEGLETVQDPTTPFIFDRSAVNGDMVTLEVKGSTMGVSGSFTMSIRDNPGFVADPQTYVMETAICDSSGGGVATCTRDRTVTLP